jgi:ferric-dicitrate binding protein FerR (iron transport regulator)
MKNYNNCSVEDLVLDAYFRKWSLGELPSKDTFWEKWLEEYPEKTQLIEDAKSLVIALKVKNTDMFSDEEINDGIQNILVETQHKYPGLKIISFKWLRIAASIAIIFGLSWWMTSKNVLNITNIDTISSIEQKATHTNHGKQSIIFELADGSKITLEPQSELRYGNEFGKEKREVFLTGGAFFDVAKDTQRPFLVYTGKLVTKVVGTSFRIQAYEKDNDISVAVRSGKVTVYRQDRKSKNSKSLSTEIVLIPNQKAVFEKEQELLVKTLVDKPIRLDTIPENASLVFSETKVSDIFSRLEGIYGVKIGFDKDVFNKCTVTASFQTETLYEKLALICEIIQAKYEIVDGEIMIYGKGC